MLASSRPEQETRELGEFDLAILSDLHLGEGRDPATKKFSLKEDFFFDESFDRFVDHLKREAGRTGRSWKLIFAGDLADFLQIRAIPENQDFPLRPSERLFGLGTSPEKTVWKLQRMMAGHRKFFEALGRFICAGNRCVIITGNHDIEWSVPKVREAFLDEMKKYIRSGNTSTLDQAIEFCRWFYYEPDLLWVEHGHQYDGINSFDYFLHPYLPDSQELMLPAGSFFVRYLFNEVEHLHPFADNVKPISAYLRGNWPKLLLSRNMLKHLKAFWRILGKSHEFTEEELNKLEIEQDKILQQEAQDFGIDLSKLQSIKRLWVPSFLYNKTRMENLWMFLSYESGNHLPSIASKISQELAVRYVVFGHTHNADLQAIKPDWSAEYVNSGTWVKTFSHDLSDRLLHEEQESVFVRILKSEGDKMELLKWREDIDDATRVNLFERR
ncbi:MAG: hypothetical protein ABIN58_05160 [candidate division WOR-3 bacterium]